jgi:hypothetical protein
MNVDKFSTERAKPSKKRAFSTIVVDKFSTSCTRAERPAYYPQKQWISFQHFPHLAALLSAAKVILRCAQDLIHQAMDNEILSAAKDDIC